MSGASVLVAMSGGVDSSVAAAVLVDAGYEVVGVTMKMHDTPEARGAKAGCCTVADADDAKAVAARLGIDHYTLDMTAPFERGVIDAFVSQYAGGRTPNPCVECNRHVKFTELIDRADRLGIDLVATGHHARLDGHELRRGADAAKDQSYVVACLPPAVLDRVLLPVGDMTKAEVRAAAADLGLRTATKAESMGVCFLGPGGVAGFLERRLPVRPGPAVTADGDVVGTHRGAVLYTVGQRRGIDSGLNTRLYVHAVDVEANTVVVSDAAPLAGVLAAEDPTWLSPPEAAFDATVQTSAHGTATPGRVGLGPPGRVTVELAEAVAAPAPGQLAVFYDGDTVVGSATITAVSGPEGAAEAIAFADVRQET